MCECDQISRMENNDFSFCKRRVREHLACLCLAAGGCTWHKKQINLSVIMCSGKQNLLNFFCMQKVLSSSPVLCLV